MTTVAVIIAPVAVEERDAGVAKQTSHRQGPATAEGRSGLMPRGSISGRCRTFLGYALRRASSTVYQDFFRAFAKIKLRPAEFAVLTVIERNPGLKQTEVAAALAIKRTNFVGLAHALERRGLVERRASPQDRRSNALYITDDGKALARRAREVIEAHERRFAAALGKDGFERLVTLLHKVADIEKAANSVFIATAAQPRPAGSASI